LASGADKSHEHLPTMAAHDTVELTVPQKMFLQRMLAEHCWTEKEAKKVHTETQAASSLRETIQCCNTQLAQFGLEIVSLTLKETCYYTLMNQYPDPMVRDIYAPIHFQPQALQQYLQDIFLHLLQAPERSATRAVLLNLKHNAQNGGDLSLSRVEDMLERWIEERWLMSSTNHQITIGPRSYCELSYLWTTTDLADSVTAPIPQPVFIRL
jgi:hypothetical protein